jgi:hypothetical protein
MMMPMLRMAQFETRALNFSHQSSLAPEVRVGPHPHEPVKIGVSFLIRMTADPRLVRGTVTDGLTVHRPSSVIALLLRSCPCCRML